MPKRPEATRALGLRCRGYEPTMPGSGWIMSMML